MAVLSGSDTVAAISQSTGCYELNLATNHSFLFGLCFYGSGWFSLWSSIQMWLYCMQTCTHTLSTYAFSHTFSCDLCGRFYTCSHWGEGLTLQSGASGSPRSLPLPQCLGALGRRQELINDNARSAGGEEHRFATEQCCRGTLVTLQCCYR